MKKNHNFQKIVSRILLYITLGSSISACNMNSSKSGDSMKTSEYSVNRIDGDLTLNADWNKDAWKNIEPLTLTHYMGEKPDFDHEVKAKLLYNDDAIFVIFKVMDKYVRCTVDSINGPVWEDSCVEFFFAPDSENPLKYFNLEINCAGTPLMHYNIVPRKDFYDIPPEEIKKIKIASSYDNISEQETEGPVTWVLEYRIPITLLEEFSSVNDPAPGVEWKGNFYKIADKSSHPHYITWSPIKEKEPDFHKPEYFGTIKFK